MVWRYASAVLSSLTNLEELDFRPGTNATYPRSNDETEPVSFLSLPRLRKLHSRGLSPLVEFDAPLLTDLVIHSPHEPNTYLARHSLLTALHLVNHYYKTQTSSATEPIHSLRLRALTLCRSDYGMVSFHTPNLEFLSCERAPPLSLLKQCANTLTELELLHFMSLFLSSYEGLVFPTLKVLRLASASPTLISWKIPSLQALHLSSSSSFLHSMHIVYPLAPHTLTLISNPSLSSNTTHHSPSLPRVHSLVRVLRFGPAAWLLQEMLTQDSFPNLHVLVLVGPASQTLENLHQTLFRSSSSSSSSSLCFPSLQWLVFEGAVYEANKHHFLLRALWHTLRRIAPNLQGLHLPGLSPSEHRSTRAWIQPKHEEDALFARVIHSHYPSHLLL